jgi:hypothetical protein
MAPEKLSKSFSLKTNNINVASIQSFMLAKNLNTTAVAKEN